MSRVALVSDTHFGVYKGSALFLESSLRFFREFVIPKMKEAGIDTLIHAGDFFDNRSSIDIRVLNEVFKLFREDLCDFKVYCIVGNHDTVFKTSIEVNSVETLRGFKNVTVISKPTMLTPQVALVPWIVNFNEFEDFIIEQMPSITIGHFEIVGGKTSNGVVDSNPEHIDPNYFFGKTDLVLSGHYHQRSSQRVNGVDIVYFGNAYHLNRGDAGDKRGIVFLDIDTRKIEYVDDMNVSMRYVKLYYPQELNPKRINGNIVDIHVNISREGYDEKDFADYVSKVEACNPAIPPYVRIERDNTIAVDSVDLSGAGTTREILSEYISKLKIDDSTRLKLNEKIKTLGETIEREKAEN